MGHFRWLPDISYRTPKILQIVRRAFIYQYSRVIPAEGLEPTLPKEHDFTALLCRPIAAQFMGSGVIALFEFSMTDDGIRVVVERHYQLVPPDSLSEEELLGYRKLSPCE
ncbi:MAG: hypothetical protein M0Q93_04770 [Terrimicrobiaceae bacterium]|nr:hypothetical protein [Terrimicrobiaceae bacterium]